MKRTILAVSLTFIAGLATALEVDFNNLEFTSGIPEGWKEASNLSSGRNLSIQNPDTVGGLKALSFSFYNATENATRVLYYSNAIENVACDNVSAEISTYRKKGLSGKIDKVEVVVSTNDFATCQTVGQIDLQELARETDGWVTNQVSAYIEGLSSEETKNNVKVGLKVIGAGASSKYGYIGWMKTDFVASATPKDIGFVTLEDGGSYSSLETLVPGETNAMVSTTVSGLPAGKISFTNVYATVTRNGRPSDEMQLFRVGDTEQYVSSPITNAFDAGEAVSISIRTEYAVVPPEPPDPPLPTLGKQEDGIAKEYASSAEKIVGQKGSVWINEIVVDGNELAIEFAGTTNRVMTSGWKVAISNGTSGTTELEHPISGRLDFTSKVVNDVVGFDVRRFGSDAIMSGTNVVRLINSRDICECEVKVVNGGERFAYGLAGIATWNDEYGYSYDWTGTGDDVSAGEGVFRWLTNTVDKATIGDVNYAQGFKVPFSTTIIIKTATGSGADLPYAAVSVLAHDVTNVVESIESLFSAQTSSNGVAVISFSGHSCSNSSDRIPVKVSASAFGWNADEILYEVELASNVTNDFTVPMARMPAFYDCDSLAEYWRQTDSTKWAVYSSGGRKCIRLNLYNARAGTNSIMRCVNPLSSDGKKYVSVSFDFRNTEDANMQKYNELCVSLGTNSTWSGTVVDAIVLSNKRVEYAKDEWYPYNAIVELPKGFEETDLWLCIVSRTIGGASSAYLYVDNLRIAFQDVATPTNLVRSIEQPASGESVSFDLDVIPQTTGTVAEVSADLHLVLNGVTNLVPFAFMTNDTFTSEIFASDYTNAIPLVVEDVETQAAKKVQLTISTNALETALGRTLGLNRPFLPGDEVTYFAAVHYNSDNGATTPDELYETRYFPDNSTIDGEGHWVVEGDYGVNTNLQAYSFTVAGPALSKFGEVVPSAEGVKFNLHGYDPNGISSLTINLNGQNYAPFEGLDTNAQVRVTGTWELPTGLAANTDYTVTINAKDANGNDLTPATFTFTTLPVLNSATISAVATNAVELTVEGSAAGYVVPAGWVASGANTWRWSVPTPNANVTWESVPVYGTNKVGAASETVCATPTSLYTLAAPARTAPVVSNVVTTVTVQADKDHNDGNSEFTLYGLRITTSDANDTARYATTNGVEVWKTLAAWKNDAPLELAEPIINLSATNYYCFVARNNDGIEALEGAAVTTNWFGMTTGFVGEGQQATEPFGPGKLRGSVAFTLEAFDPAKSASATNVVQCEIGTNVWIHAYPIQFTDLTITNSFVWDAWKDVSNRFGAVQWETNYTLRAIVTDGKRSSAEQEVSGRLDFAPPANLTIEGAPAEGRATSATSCNPTFSATDTNRFGYHWALTGAAVREGTGSSASITGLVDGDYTLTVTATDVMGNVSETNRHWTVDTVVPTVTRFETTTPLHFNAAKVPMVVTVEFSEPVTGFAADDVAVDKCTVSAVKGSGTTYTFEVTPTQQGEISVQIKANAVTDRAGNGNTASATPLTRTYDTTPPTVTRFETATPAYFNAEAAPMLLTVAFSEPVASFTTNDVTVSNGCATNVMQVAEAYVVAIAPYADGPVTVQIAANAVTDLADNGNGASDTLMRTYDNTAPSTLGVVGTPWNGCVTNKTDYSLTATASDAIITEASNLIFHWSINGTPVNTMGNTLTGAVSEDGPYTVSVYVTDLASNVSATASYSWTLDQQPPTDLGITGDPATLVVTNGTGFAFEAINATDAHTPLTYRWTLNGFVVGETSSRFSGTTELEGTNTVSVWAIDAAGNESLTPVSRTWVVDTIAPSNLVVTGVPSSPTEVPAFTLGASSSDATEISYHWTLNDSVAGDFSSTFSGTAIEGANTVSVYATDAAGNSSATNTMRWVLDTTAPSNFVFVVAPDKGAITNVAAFEITVSADDLTTLTYDWTLIEPSGKKKTGRTTGTFSATAVEGTNTVSVVAKDALGHPCEETITRTWVVDLTPPTMPAISGTPWNECVTNETAYNLTATASDAITEASKLVFHWSINGTLVDNNTTSNLTGTVSEDGTYEVSVYVTDEAGNNSPTNSYSWTFDRQPPTYLGITGDPAAPGLDGRLFVTNETGFAFEAISATDAHLPITYRWTLNGSAVGETSSTFSGATELEGTNTVNVWAIDAAGNESEMPASRTWVVDLTPPTEPQVSGVPENNGTNFTNKAEFKLTATAEDATALTYHWTFNGTELPEVIGKTLADTNTTGVIDGENIVSVYATDEAGNSSVTKTVSWTYDTNMPTVVLSTETPESPYVFNDYHVFKVRVEFREPVVNFTTSSVTVSNGTVTNVVPVAGSDVAYEVMIRPLADGEVVVQVESNKVTDLAGNWNDASEPLTRTCDITHPKVTITDADGELGPIDPEITEWYVLVRFDEKVQSFTTGEVTVNTGTVVRVMSTANQYEYRVKITFDGDYNGPVTVQVDADKVTDLAGNGNDASNKLRRDHGDSSGDVEFGKGVCVKVDPETGTNSVSFTAIDFKPGATSTFTLSGFAASTQSTEGSDLQMWFVVCDTLGGATRHVPVTFVKFESGELTVTLPASATEGKSTFFILGIDNKDEGSQQ